MIDQLQTTRGDQTMRNLGTVVLMSRSGDDLTDALAIRLLGATQRGAEHFLVFSVETLGGYTTDRVVISDSANHEINIDLSEDAVVKPLIQYFEVHTGRDLSTSSGWSMTYNINATSSRTPRRRSTWVYTKAHAAGPGRPIRSVLQSITDRLRRLFR